MGLYEGSMFGDEGISCIFASGIERSFVKP
jgi:hypothetical protein